MLRSSLTAAGVLMLSASAIAQADASAKIHPITSPVKNAGVYHLATGTWTRHASQADIGADTIYDNTCNSGFFSGFSGDTFVDEGRLPSPSSPSNLGSRPGCATSYLIDGFELGYCTDQPTATIGTYTVNFYQSQPACTTVVGVTPTASFAITGLPGASAAGALCWLVDIDLDSPPLTASLAFTMLADGDGTFALPATTNLFGWSFTSNAPGVATGPIIAGDPNVCGQFDGTRWDSPINYAEAGTGMTTQNLFYIEGPTTAPGCYYFGPTGPYASFHLELYADACGPPPTAAVVFCEGSAANPTPGCPCLNNSASGAGLGCLSSFGVGAGLRATGNASISADTLRLNGTNLPAASCLFFQGTTRQGGGTGAIFGDGLRCAGGTVIRLHTHTAQGTPGSAVSSYPSTGADHTGPPDLSVSARGVVTTPGTRTYQVWYRNSAAHCTAGTFNLSNGLEVTFSL